MDLSVLHYYILMLGTMAATTFLLCGFIVLFGGKNPMEDDTHSTPLQKTVSVAMFLSFLSIFLHVLSEGFISNPARWTLFIDWLTYLTISGIPLQSVLLRQKKIYPRQYVICLWPMVLMGVFVLVWGNVYPEWISYFGYGVFVYQLFIYCVGLMQLRMWDKRMKEEYSDITHKQTAWFRQLTLPFMLLILMWIPIYLFPKLAWLWVVFFILEILFCVLITCHALLQEEFDIPYESFLAEDAAKTAASSANIKQESVSDEAILNAPWVARLKEAMEKKKLYRDMNLTSTQLSQEVGVNRTYLSSYFSHTEAGTFYEYVNAFRLEEARKWLQDTDESIVWIASRCGFSSPTMFARLYKDRYHETPSQTRKNMGRL